MYFPNANSLGFKAYRSIFGEHHCPSFDKRASHPVVEISLFVRATEDWINHLIINISVQTNCLKHESDVIYHQSHVTLIRFRPDFILDLHWHLVAETWQFRHCVLDQLQSELLGRKLIVFGLFSLFVSTKSSTVFHYCLQQTLSTL